MLLLFCLSQCANRHYKEAYTYDLAGFDKNVLQKGISEHGNFHPIAVTKSDRQLAPAQYYSQSRFYHNPYEVYYPQHDQGQDMDLYYKYSHEIGNSQNNTISNTNNNMSQNEYKRYINAGSLKSKPRSRYYQNPYQYQSAKHFGQKDIDEYYKPTYRYNNVEPE